MAALAIAQCITKKGGGGQIRTLAMKTILEYRGAAFCPETWRLRGRIRRFKRWRGYHIRILSNRGYRSSHPESQDHISKEMYWNRMDVHYRIRSAWHVEGSSLRDVGTLYDFSPDVFLKRNLCEAELDVIHKLKVSDRKNHRIYAELKDAIKNQPAHHKTANYIVLNAINRYRSDHMKRQAYYDDLWGSFGQLRDGICAGTTLYPEGLWYMDGKRGWLDRNYGGAALFWECYGRQKEIVKQLRRTQLSEPHLYMDVLLMMNELYYKLNAHPDHIWSCRDPRHKNSKIDTWRKRSRCLDKGLWWNQNWTWIV